MNPNLVRAIRQMHPLVQTLAARLHVLANRPEMRKEFDLTRQGWEVGEAITVNRECDGFDWYFNGVEMMHERTWFPWSPFKDIISSYWTSRIYKDKALAEEMAKKYDGKVSECFYCDENDPTWFVKFNDFDKAAQYCEELQ